MQVRDLMNPSVVSITPSESASLAARLLSRHNVGSLPVCGEDGGLRGIVTDRDIILRCVAAEEDPDDDAREATRIMAAKQVRRLPVLEGGKVVGMVSLGDLAQCRQFDMEASKALCEISDQVKHGYVE